MKCSISFILISFLQLARTLQAIILIYKQQNLPPRMEKKFTFKQHWLLLVKRTATTAGNTTQVITNIKYEQPKDNKKVQP